MGSHGGATPEGQKKVLEHYGITKIGRIVVRDLTPDSDGNALGIGNADFITRRLVEKIDRRIS